MSKEDHVQIYQMLSVLFLTASKGEQAQQCIREVVTSHPLFSPLPLFKYISKNGTVIKKEHLLNFLEQNKEHASEEEVKVILEFIGGKNSWQYTDFLEFIYPFNSAVVREITNLHLKRYQKLQKYGVHEAAATGFLMMLSEQLQLMRKLQVQKGDSLLKISKERLRKVLLSIKRAGDRQPSHCQNDDTRITSLQLRNFMKAFVSVEDSHFLYLSRKLGIKNGSFPLESLQKFIKPRKNHTKNKKTSYSIYNQQKSKSTLKQSQQEQNNFNQKSYKQELYQELSQNLHVKNSRKMNYNHVNHELKHRDINVPQINRGKQTKIDIDLHQNKPQIVALRFQPVDNYFINKPKQQTRKTSPKELLLKFVEILLPAARQLQDLKLKVAQHKIDYLGLFKSIDRSHRGVANAQDLYQYYLSKGGYLQLTPQEFQLIIQRYGQSEEPWLTFAQFCQMIRAQQKEVSNKNIIKFGQSVDQLILSIIQISVKNELSLLKIRKQFTPQQSNYLFNIINRQHTGFINYQQLKKFLSEAGLHLSMHDLMQVLKKLDRSRNGVIVQHEFTSYFQPPPNY